MTDQVKSAREQAHAERETAERNLVFTNEKIERLEEQVDDKAEEMDKLDFLSGIKEPDVEAQTKLASASQRLANLEQELAGKQAQLEEQLEQSERERDEAVKLKSENEELQSLLQDRPLAAQANELIASTDREAELYKVRSMLQDIVDSPRQNPE